MTDEKTEHRNELQQDAELHLTKSLFALDVSGSTAKSCRCETRTNLHGDEPQPLVFPQARPV
jgi:hypothetical protein